MCKLLKIARNPIILSEKYATQVSKDVGFSCNVKDMSETVKETKMHLVSEKNRSYKGIWRFIQYKPCVHKSEDIDVIKLFLLVFIMYHSGKSILKLHFFPYL